MRYLVIGRQLLHQLRKSLNILKYWSEATLLPNMRKLGKAVNVLCKKGQLDNLARLF